MTRIARATFDALYGSRERSSMEILWAAQFAYTLPVEVLYGIGYFVSTAQSIGTEI